MPNLVVHQPPNNLIVKLNQPFLVTGQATDRGMPEPNLIDSVTVQVDSSQPVEATLTRIPNKKLSIVAFKAFAQVTSGKDPHTVTVTATNDIGVSVKKTVTVFTGPVFQVAPPALILDLRNPFPIDPNDPKIALWVSEIQRQLIPLSTSLASVGKKLAGPNLLFINKPNSLQVMRLGLWIEDATFPVRPPSPPAFPLPRLSEQAASEGFKMTPVLPIPNLAGISPAFALSIPVTTLQHLLDAVAPMLKTALSPYASLEALTVHTNSPGSVTTSLVGSAPAGDLPINIGFTITITEVVGTQVVDNIEAPVVIGSSHSESVGDLLDWLVGFLFPIFGLALGAALGYLHVKARSASRQIDGMIASLIAGIPTRIPFRNTMLPAGGVVPDFPVLVSNWKSFGVDDSGILGTGNTTIEERDQSMVSLTLDGSTSIAGYQVDLNGGAGWTYNFRLVNLAPDPDKFKWQASGTNSSGGNIDIDTLDQAASFSTFFRLPAKVKPGKFPFTLSVDATETCGTDPHKKLSASDSIAVKVEVRKNPKVPL